MRCPKCGSDNREGRKFCAKCGAPLRVRAHSVAPRTSPAEGSAAIAARDSQGKASLAPAGKPAAISEYASASRPERGNSRG